MASWLGYASTEFISADKTISLPLKTSASGTVKDPSTTQANGSNGRSLLSFCKAVTPPCVLWPMLPGGHFQTMYAAVKKSPARANLHYKRRIFDSTYKPYPGCFAVDFVTRIPTSQESELVNPRTTLWQDADWQRYVKTGCVDANDEQSVKAAKRPLIVALHGISGGSQELYLREVLAPLISGTPTQVGEGGDVAQEWDAIVVNARGCANSPLKGDRIFNARATWDLRQFLDWLHETFPDRLLFGVGFSLGANILTNYLGEEGPKTPLSAAVLCSNPWNLEISNLLLQQTWYGREIYLKALCSGMKKLVTRHADVLATNPNIQIDRILATKYLHDFDRELQAPTWGYPSEGAYYRDASSADAVVAVRIPVFALHAEDDPVCGKECLPIHEIRGNPFAVLCTTSMGGHLSWFETSEERWFVKPTVNFLRAAADEVDFKALRKQTLQAASDTSIKQGLAAFEPARKKLYIP